MSTPKLTLYIPMNVDHHLLYIYEQEMTSYIGIYYHTAHIL